ncbi:WXG100 family type VII secretion target [Streptomyces sp. ODS28]|uniref:WXG100 family type VII secretion target n=1 Tax=Streptomyces sp. ODS28 TaxID=3136688 RepID=UPI0031EE5901
MSERDDLQSTVDEFSGKEDDFKAEQSDFQDASDEIEAARDKYEKTASEIEDRAGADPDYTQAEHDADKKALQDAHDEYEGKYEEYEKARDNYNDARNDYKDSYDEYKGAAHQLLRIDLAALSRATDKVGNIAVEIGHEMDSIEKLMSEINENWKGPAYDTFEPMQLWFRDLQKELLELLLEIIIRMKISHENYQDAEEKNFQNVTPSGGDA